MALPREIFGAALLMHRTRLGLTQAEAASLCEVSPRVWWKWEKAAGDTMAVTQEGVIARLKFAKKKS
jgi:transcriptional regulator with XRE-family HTH domain